jgi:hypothetical protein
VGTGREHELDETGLWSSLYDREELTMSLQNHDRSVGLRCSTCAGVDFKRDPELDDGPIECAGCGRIFTREQLIAENGEIIDIALDEMKADIVADVRTQFRKAFQGFKHIKLR